MFKAQNMSCLTDYLGVIIHHYETCIVLTIECHVKASLFSDGDETVLTQSDFFFSATDHESLHDVLVTLRTTFPNHLLVDNRIKEDN